MYNHINNKKFKKNLKNFADVFYFILYFTEWHSNNFTLEL